MIPKTNDGLRVNFKFGERPTKTHALRVDRDVITGWVDRREAMRQAIYLILNVERYEHIIYSWNYGVELANLFGKPIPFCMPEIKRRITDALMQDKRITGVDEFTFEHRKGIIFTTFLVRTIFGDIRAEREVAV